MDTVAVARVVFWSEIPIGASFHVFNVSSKRIVTLENRPYDNYIQSYIISYIHQYYRSPS